MAIDFNCVVLTFEDIGDIVMIFEEVVEVNLFVGAVLIDVVVGEAVDDV